jgi:hypothetical protein
MRTTKSLIAIACAMTLLATPMLLRSDDKKPCCEPTVEAGKKCEHKCCVTAANDGKVCEKCHKKS